MDRRAGLEPRNQGTDRKYTNHPMGDSTPTNVSTKPQAAQSREKGSRRLLTPPPSIQLVFSNFYIGIALGALDFASAYTAKNTRSWPYTPSPVPSGAEEPYILQRYGSFLAHLRAAEALADVAGTKIRDIYLLHSEKRDITAAERGEVAEWVASVKVVATDTALRVTSGVFETTGARATAAKVGLDRFWRDVRTHTLHDPVAYKEQELGRYLVKGQVPEPTWYT